MFRLITSADSRLAAISKVVRVRVEFSKNTLKMDLPRSSGTFFTSRSFTLTNCEAVSRMCRIISAGRPSVVSRCTQAPLRVDLQAAVHHGLLTAARRSLPPSLVSTSSSSGSDLDEGAGEIRRDGQLAPAAIGQDGEAHALRPPEVPQLVQRRADGAPGVQHVVHEHDVAPVDLEGQVAAARLAMQADAAEVVAVQRHGEHGPSGVLTPSARCRRSATQAPPV